MQTAPRMHARNPSTGSKLVGPNHPRLSIFLVHTYAWENVTMKRAQRSQSDKSVPAVVPGLRGGIIVFLLSIFFVHADAADNENVIRTQQAHSNPSKSTMVPAFRTGKKISRLSLFLVHRGTGDNVDMKRTQQFQLAESTPAVAVDSKMITVTSDTTDEGGIRHE